MKINKLYATETNVTNIILNKKREFSPSQNSIYIKLKTINETTVWGLPPLRGVMTGIGRLRGYW